MMADGSSEDIEAVLRAAPSEVWAELAEAVDAFRGESEHSKWAGGQPMETTVVDGVERQVLQMPWVEYSPTVRRILSLLDRLGVVHPFDWPGWDGSRRLRSPEAIAAAPVGDAARLATVVIRGERFCDGSIRGAIDDGTFAAILERLLGWYENRR
jgi:hypothetical protein